MVFVLLLVIFILLQIFSLNLSFALHASQVVLAVKNLPADAGDLRGMGSIPGSGRSPIGGHGNTMQYSCLENPHGQRSLVGYSPLGQQRVGHD